jgi:hypothetical protein
VGQLTIRTMPRKFTRPPEAASDRELGRNFRAAKRHTVIAQHPGATYLLQRATISRPSKLTPVCARSAAQSGRLSSACAARGLPPISRTPVSSVREI